MTHVARAAEAQWSRKSLFHTNKNMGFISANDNVRGKDEFSTKYYIKEGWQVDKCMCVNLQLRVAELL